MESNGPRASRILCDHVLSLEHQHAPPKGVSHPRHEEPAEDNANIVRSWLHQVMIDEHFSTIHQNVKGILCMCGTPPCLCEKPGECEFIALRGLPKDDKLLAMRKLSKDTTRRLEGIAILGKRPRVEDKSKL